MLGSCSFEPCFDFFFCSEAAFAEAGDFVDGADGDARGDEPCLPADGGFGRGLGCGEGGCHPCRESQNGRVGKGIIQGDILRGAKGEPSGFWVRVWHCLSIALALVLF